MPKVPSQALTRVFKILSGVMLTMTLFSCSKSGSELTGIWDNLKAPEIVEFKPDGTGSFSYASKNNPPLSFTWKQTAPNSYALDVSYRGKKAPLAGTLKGKTLSLESAVGKEEYSRRAAR